MINERKIAAEVDVWAALHRDELLHDLKELIAIRSVAQPGEGGYALGTGCHLAAEKLQELARKYGFASENDDDYAVSVLLPGSATTRELGILGHIDVVPEGEGWQHDPFCAIEKNGWLIGRGSSDNKGPVVMALHALRCIREKGYAFKSGLRLIAGCCEETDMQDVVHYLKKHDAPAYTLNCDGAWAACVGEKGILTAQLEVDLTDGNLIAMGGGKASNMVPDEAWALLSTANEAALEKAKSLCRDLTVQPDEKGVLLRMSGKAAHCFVPDQGKNAITRLIHLLCDVQLLHGDAAIQMDRLRQCFPDSLGTGLRINHQDSISGRTTCVASLLRLENGVLSLHINVRFAITQKSGLLLQALRKRLNKLGIRLTDVQLSEPRYDAPDQPIVKMLVETCQSWLDAKYKPYVMGGGTHSRLFPRSLPYGVGVMDPRFKNPFGEPHGPNEAVYIDHLLKAMKVYVIALMKLDEYFESNS